MVGMTDTKALLAPSANVAKREHARIRTDMTNGLFMTTYN